MLLAAITKEFKLVFRDVHSVLVLFIMPAAFIIIMSLALQEQFTEESRFTLKIHYTNKEDSEYSQKFISLLSSNKNVNFVATQLRDTPKDIKKLLENKSTAYLTIPKSLFDHFQSDLKGVEPLQLWFSPNIDTRTRLLIESTIQEALAKTKFSFMYTPQLSKEEKEAAFISDKSIKTRYISGANHSEESDLIKKPTSVQQNVPAWLIFSMFFVVIPISTTLITEKQQGTLTRLRTMNISMGLFLLAKTLPYLLINQVQLIIMLLIGIYLIPLLGGDNLVIGSHYFSLACMSLAVGISAVGYALFIAVIAKTTEQATSIGGVGNILLGAVGGIMVPKFVMPDYLQTFTAISPMSWGLDGFLQIFLYGSGFSAIYFEVIMLLTFGFAMMAIALGIFYKQS